jgi:hypothetical protein
VNTSDWAGRFPPGLSLNPGRTLIICVTKAGFFSSGATPGAAQYFLEMRDSNGILGDDMTIITTGSLFPVTGGMMTNPSTTNGEWIVLFCWEGTSDLVCDLDYASWGANVATNPKMDKSGIAIDGPDAGAAPSSYNADTPAGAQTNLGTALVKPNTWQRTGGEVGETAIGGNGCIGKIYPTLILWTPILTTGNIRFQVRWTNPDEDAMSTPVSGSMMSQEFGVFLPNYGNIGGFDVPALNPDSFFDVFIDIPLTSLPPNPIKRYPADGPGAPLPLPTERLDRPTPASDCPPDTNWAGNVDIIWSGPGQGGQVGKHYADLLTCIGGDPSYIHFRPSNCAAPMTWTVTGLCPGFSATLVNEDFTPAPNPVPVGWSGWICVSAGAAVPSGTNCCFSVVFVCSGSTAVIDICSTACDCRSHPPTLTSVDWTTVGTMVRFHQRWENTAPTGMSDPVSGQMSSQEFGVFLPNYGAIGPFSVPELAPNSFFDIFFDVPLTQLPPNPVIRLPGGGPPTGSPCPPSTTWHGNVDVVWTGSGTTGEVNRHFGELLINPGAGPSYIHTLTGCPSGAGASWSINGLCSGFNATLVNEDFTPAPNPIPSGWTGWICVSSPPGTPDGTTCCFTVVLVCNNVPATIEVCAKTCTWSTSAVPPDPGITFGIYLATPNPASQGMTVGYVIPNSGHARLDVYNISGQLVRKLHDGPTAAGPNTVTWNGRSENGQELAPGTYFLTLTADGRKASRKIVMVR